MPNAKVRSFRPNARLTRFLVELLIDENLATAFNNDKAGVLSSSKLPRKVLNAIDANDRKGLKAMIGGQQGGRGQGRAAEANRLARKAAGLGKKR